MYTACVYVNVFHLVGYIASLRIDACKHFIARRGVSTVHYSAPSNREQCFVGIVLHQISKERWKEG